MVGHLFPRATPLSRRERTSLPNGGGRESGLVRRKQGSRGRHAPPFLVPATSFRATPFVWPRRAHGPRVVGTTSLEPKAVLHRAFEEDAPELVELLVRQRLFPHPCGISHLDWRFGSGCEPPARCNRGQAESGHGVPKGRSSATRDWGWLRVYLCPSPCPRSGYSWTSTGSSPPSWASRPSRKATIVRKSHALWAIPSPPRVHSSTTAFQAESE